MEIKSFFLKRVQAWNGFCIVYLIQQSFFFSIKNSSHRAFAAINSSPQTCKKGQLAKSWYDIIKITA